MTKLVPATSLAQLMDEIEAGQWTLSGQLSMISEACLYWKMLNPEQFVASYDRFEKARQAVRLDATDEEWTELRSAAAELGAAFRSVA